MTYNVRSMRDDRDALGRVMSSAECDVVLIQEAPRFLRWRSLCGELARRAGMVVVSGGRAAGANLILSRLGVDATRTVDVLFTKDAGLHQRGVAIAVLNVRGVEFAVAGTHLDVKDEPRLRHVGELHDAIDRNVSPEIVTILGGDFNCEPDSEPWRVLAAQRQDAFAVRAAAVRGLTSNPLASRRTQDRWNLRRSPHHREPAPTCPMAPTPSSPLTTFQ